MYLLVATRFPKSYKNTFIILKLAQDCHHCKELNSSAKHYRTLHVLIPPIFYMPNNIIQNLFNREKTENKESIVTFF